MERLAELAAKADDIRPEVSRHLQKLIDQFDYESLSRLLMADEHENRYQGKTEELSD